MSFLIVQKRGTLTFPLSCKESETALSQVRGVLRLPDVKAPRVLAWAAGCNLHLSLSVYLRKIFPDKIKAFLFSGTCLTFIAEVKRGR